MDILGFGVQVMLIGLVVVFVGLILLIICVKIMDKLVNKSEEGKPAAPAPAPAPAPAAAPAGAEAIKASHENLRLLARKAQKTFGSGLLNVGYLAACVRDNYAYKRQQLYLTKPAWEPVFEPDAAMLSGIGDGIGKINQAVPGYFGKTNLRDMTGVDPES